MSTRDGDHITRTYVGEGGLIILVGSVTSDRLAGACRRVEHERTVVVGVVGVVNHKLQVSTVVTSGHGELEVTTIDDVEVAIRLVVNRGGLPRSIERNGLLVLTGVVRVVNLVVEQRERPSRFSLLGSHGLSATGCAVNSPGVVLCCGRGD